MQAGHLVALPRLAQSIQFDRWNVMMWPHCMHANLSTPGAAQSPPKKVRPRDSFNPSEHEKMVP
jgi:hypothetical protein